MQTLLHLESCALMIGEWRICITIPVSFTEMEAIPPPTGCLKVFSYKGSLIKRIR
jgi:hypothetical protein